MVSAFTRLNHFLVPFIKDAYFLPKVPHFSEDKHPSQAGKVWIVTGSTSGIGFEVAVRLAQLGAEVWLVGRSQQRAEEHIAKLKAKVPGAKVDFLLMDLADLPTIKPGVAKFLESGSSLHGVVHNAGVMLVPHGSKTKQGWELTLGTNVIATWLLQKLLDPILLKSTTTIEGRIVWVSSLMHVMSSYSGDEMAQDPTIAGARTDEAYNVSKALNIMESIQWTKLHPNANVKSTSVHPGLLETNLTRDINQGVASIFKKFVAWPAWYGAVSELFAAIGDLPNNAYAVPWGQVGVIRPDIVAGAERNTQLGEWLNQQVKQYE